MCDGDLCIHELLPDECSLCRHRGDKRTVAVRTRPFPARYDGACFVCGELVEQGDLICYDNDRVVHDEC